MRFLPLVLKNLLRKKTRTFLTIGSVLFPVLLIAFLGTFLRTLELPDPARQRGLFRLVTRHKVGLTTSIPLAYARRIEALPGVRALTPIDRFGGTYRDASARNIFPRFAVDPSAFLEVFDDAEIVAGDIAEWRRDRSGGLAGENLVKKYGWRIGEKVVVRGTLYPFDLELTVRAVYRLPYENSASLFFHRAYLEEAWPPFRGTASTLWTRCTDGAAAERLPSEIDASFENSPYPTSTTSENAFQLGFVSLLGNVQMLLTSMGVVIVFVIVLVAANTVALAARERVVEIAVMRALGFSRLGIVLLVVGESLVMALAGGVLGLGGFVLALGRLKGALMTTRLSPFAAGMKVFPEILAIGVAVALFIGVAAALVPAVRAGRRPIVDGLRAAV